MRIANYGTQIAVMPHTVSEIKYSAHALSAASRTPGNVTLRIQAFQRPGPGIPNAEIHRRVC